jgi:hypothetical protein
MEVGSTFFAFFLRQMMIIMGTSSGCLIPCSLFFLCPLTCSPVQQHLSSRLIWVAYSMAKFDYGQLRSSALHAGGASYVIRMNPDACLC